MSPIMHKLFSELLADSFLAGRHIEPNMFFFYFALVMVLIITAEDYRQYLRIPRYILDV